MKQSELLKAALRAYGKEDYMCYVLEDIARIRDAVATHALKKRIMTILQTQYTITLSNYLYDTDSTYKRIVADWGHDSEQAHNLRLEFWYDMIIQLEREGL